MTLSDPSEARGALVKRWGGKHSMASVIVPRLARRDVYIEPFFGAGGVFFQIPEGTFKAEAVNDLDRDITTFFRVVRDQPQRLHDLLLLTPYALDEFIASSVDSDDEVEHARRVFVRLRQSFAGLGTHTKGWSRSGRGGDSNKPATFCAALSDFWVYVKRLRLVEVDRSDAALFVHRRAAANTMAYVDPPYPLTSRRAAAYNHEMTDEQHVALAGELHRARDMGTAVMVSSYASPLYDDRLYKGWRRVEVQSSLSGARLPRGVAKDRATEVLYLSYPESEEIGSGPAAAPKPKNDLERLLVKSAQLGMKRS